MDSIFVLLQRAAPQHLLSRITGRLARATGPRWLVQWVIAAFARHYRVDFTEAERPFPEAYASFNSFFTRALRE
ncbi:MAG: phosphatidylserine decarboxylase, partial [Pseudomonadota bacterium]